MPKAINLVDAYNNFVVEPLKTEEEFKDFYVERPKNAPSPIEELKDRIENADSERNTFSSASADAVRARN